LWWRFALPIGLFAGMLVIALALVRDFSPLLILLLWLIGSSLAYSVAGRGWGGLAIALILTAALAGGLIWLHHMPASALSAINMYPDRFAVWQTPGLHPHTGEQFRLAFNLWQIGGTFGRPALAHMDGLALRVAAIQDDFAASFFVLRHGVVGAGLLVAAQLLLVMALLATGVAALNTRAGDFRRAWLGRWAGMGLWGGAFMLLGNLLVSWGTNTGWLPVMGQPMPFLSSAGSQLLLFALPLLMLGVIVAEKE
jgi:cell division protein FtsW